MVFRWKDAKFGRNGIDQFFGPQPPHRHTIVRAKIRRKKPLFSPNPIKMWLLGYFGMQNSFLALKTELNSTVFEKNAKNKIKYLIIVIFYFL